jgi:hypothetical protein
MEALGRDIAKIKTGAKCPSLARYHHRAQTRFAFMPDTLIHNRIGHGRVQRVHLICAHQAHICHTLIYANAHPIAHLPPPRIISGYGKAYAAIGQALDQAAGLLSANIWH